MENKKNAAEVANEEIIVLETIENVEAPAEVTAEISTEVLEEVTEEVTEEVPAKKSTAKPTEKPAKRKAYNGATLLTTLGNMISDGNDLIFAEMPVDNQKAEIARMKADIKKGSVCYGKVIGVETSETSGIVMVIKRDTLRVIIPAEDFFAHSTMKDLDKDTKETRLRRYLQKGSHMFDASVSFVPKAMGKNSEDVPFVVASRKEAMDKLQEKHFYGATADVKVGSVAKASIVSVGPRYVTVECLGVESVIGTGGLSAFEYIENAAENFHRGEGLIVMVENLEVDTTNHEIKIEFSHSAVERIEAKVETASESMISGRYMATVVAVIKGYYVVIITGLKIRGLIPISDYVGTDSLIVGDSVVMLVTGVNKEKNMVIGRCMKSN